VAYLPLTVRTGQNAVRRSTRSATLSRSTCPAWSQFVHAFRSLCR